MSLTSLPNELLFEIATLLLSNEPKPGCLHCYNSNRRDCHALAATCKITRRATTNVLYKHVIMDPNQSWICNLYKIFTLDPVVASCVRRFTLVFPKHRDFSGWSNMAYLLHCYRETVKACPGVRSLLITTDYHSPQFHSTPKRIVHTKSDPKLLPGASLWSNASYSTQFWREFGNMNTILIYINPHSQKKIEHIEFKSLSTRELWLQFERLIGFTTLKTLHITDFYIDKKATKPGYNNPDRYKTIDLLNRKLPLLQSVQVLSFEMRAAESGIWPEIGSAALFQERTIGYITASSMPNITTLNIRGSYDIIYSTLTRYIDIGKNLTRLTICTQFHTPSDTHPCDTHLCDTLSALSNRLTHLTISEGSEPLYFCHKLFAGKWKRLRQFTLNDCSLPYGCDGNDLDKLRLNLLHLLNSNLAAEVVIYSRCYWGHVPDCTYTTATKLVWKKSGEKEYTILEQLFDGLSEDSNTEFVPDIFIQFGEEGSNSDSDQGGAEVVEAGITGIGGNDELEYRISDVDEWWDPKMEEIAGGSDSDSDWGGVDLPKNEKNQWVLG